MMLRDYIQKQREKDGEVFTKLADSYEFLVDHVDEFEEGELDISDLAFDDNGMNAVVINAATFGMFWEREHPSVGELHSLGRAEHALRLLAEYHPERLERFLSEYEDAERVLTDGDLFLFEEDDSDG